MVAPVATLFMIMCMIFGGFFVNTDSIPPYFIWIHYVSFITYGFETLAKNEIRQPDTAV